MKRLSHHLLLSVLIFSFVFIISCGPASNDRHQQEVQDSIRLEEDRKQLIERANRMLDNQENENQTTDSLDNPR